MTLREYFGRVFPALEDLASTLREELGLPLYTKARCLVYAAPAGPGTSLHFDANANLVIQLTGRKRWWITRNIHVIHPSDRYSTTEGRLSNICPTVSTSYPGLSPPTRRP